MLAVKLALDRAPEYQAEIKNGCMRRPDTTSPSRTCRPLFAGMVRSCYFDRLELRSKDDSRVLARAAGGRVAADIWQLIRSGKLLAGRIELDSPDIVIARLGPTRFALASEIELGGERRLAVRADAERPAGRQAGDSPCGGHAAELEFRAAAARAAGRQSGSCAAAMRACSALRLSAQLPAGARRHV